MKDKCRLNSYDTKMDSHMANEFDQSTQLYGKPTSLVNKQGINCGEFMNLSLKKLNIEELFKLAN